VPGFGCLVGLAVFSLGEVRWGVVVLLPVPYSPRSNAWLGPQPLCGCGAYGKKPNKSIQRTGKDY
jgi:hypothetical protein